MLLSWLATRVATTFLHVGEGSRRIECSSYITSAGVHQHGELTDSLKNALIIHGQMCAQTKAKDMGESETGI